MKKVLFVDKSGLKNLNQTISFIKEELFNKKVEVSEFVNEKSLEEALLSIACLNKDEVKLFILIDTPKDSAEFKDFNSFAEKVKERKNLTTCIYICSECIVSSLNEYTSIDGCLLIRKTTKEDLVELMKNFFVN